MERVKSGIPGLDDLVEGGFPKGASILVSGGAGTCKTIIGMQFIYNGAMDYGEPGLYVTVETNLKNIVWNMEGFNWDIRKLQEKNLMRVYRLQFDVTKDLAEQISVQLDTITSIVKQMKAKRLVIDSTTAFGIWIDDMGKLRNTLFTFTDAIKDLGCTTLLTAETKGGKMDFSAFGIEEFITDGVIALYFTPPNRSIFIRKMRGTAHSKRIHPFEITKKGVEVKSKDELIWEAIK